MYKQLKKDIVFYIRIYNNQQHVKDRNETINIEELKKILEILDTESLEQIKECLSIAYFNRED